MRCSSCNAREKSVIKPQLLEAVYTYLDTRRDGTMPSLVLQVRPLTWLCGRAVAGQAVKQKVGQGVEGGCSRGGGGVVILKDMEQ